MVCSSCSNGSGAIACTTSAGHRRHRDSSCRTSSGPPLIDRSCHACGRRAQSQGLRELPADRRACDRHHHPDAQPAQRLAQRRLVGRAVCRRLARDPPPVRYDPWQARAVLDQRASIIGASSGHRAGGRRRRRPERGARLWRHRAGRAQHRLELVDELAVVATRPTVSTDSPLGVLPHVVPDRYLHEMVAMGTGTSLRWFGDALAPAGASALSYGGLLPTAAPVAPGSEGLRGSPTSTHRCSRSSRARVLSSNRSRSQTARRAARSGTRSRPR